MTPPTLCTAHLTLVPLAASDTSALIELHSLPEAFFRDPPDSVPDYVGSMLPLWMSFDPLRGYGMWKIIASDQAVIGRVGLYNDGGSVPALAYFIRADQRGRGYAREAASKIIEWAFKTTAAPAFAALTEASNAPSIRVMKSLGMTRWPAACSELQTGYLLGRPGGKIAKDLAAIQT